MSLRQYTAQWVLVPKILDTAFSTTFTVPEGVEAVVAKVVAPGGNGYNNTPAGGSTRYRAGGGSGGWYDGTMFVTPGEVLELIIGDKTSIRRGDTDIVLVYRGGHAMEVFVRPGGNVNFQGAGDGGFPNGSGGGRDNIAIPAGGCGMSLSSNMGVADRPLFSPSAGGGYTHNDAIFGIGKYPGGCRGGGGRTPYPWGNAGEANLSAAGSVTPPTGGRIILTWFEPRSRAL